MAQNQLERQLVAGVRAARQGNRQRARELLEGVLKRERENEQAWIWMASIVSSSRERRICLERVLKVNPNNRAARAAINSMVGVIGGEAATIDFEAMSRAAKTPLPSGGGGQSRASTTGSTQAVGRGGGGRNLFPILVGAAVILGLIFAATIIIPLFTSQPTPEPTAVAVAVELTPEVTEEDDGSTPVPTATHTPASRATLAPRDDLPTEMIIPTETAVPTDVPSATPTISVISNYDFVFLAVEGSFAPVLYQVSGDGSGLQPMASNFYDMDAHASGVLAFTREEEIVLPTLTPSPTPSPDPQMTSIPLVDSTPRERTRIINHLFLTNLSNPLNSIEISNATHTNAFSPSISPDGEQIAFASDADGDNDIYVYDIPSRTIFRVTNNDNASDIDPDWSPDGTQMVFASDRESPGRYDIYVLTLGDDVEASVVRITKTRRGDNVHPQWSPVNNQIAYLNQDNSDTAIHMVTLETGAIRQLTRQASQLYSAPSWTSDGIYVVYSSDRAGINGLRQIFLVNPETLFELFLRLDGIDAKLAIPR